MCRGIHASTFCGKFCSCQKQQPSITSFTNRNLNVIFMLFFDHITFVPLKKCVRFDYVIQNFRLRFSMLIPCLTVIGLSASSFLSSALAGSGLSFRVQESISPLPAAVPFPAKESSFKIQKCSVKQSTFSHFSTLIYINHWTISSFPVKESHSPHFSFRFRLNTDPGSLIAAKLSRVVAKQTTDLISNHPFNRILNCEFVYPY